MSARVGVFGLICLRLSSLTTKTMTTMMQMTTRILTTTGMTRSSASTRCLVEPRSYSFRLDAPEPIARQEFWLLARDVVNTCCPFELVERHQVENTLKR
jgi:hypothetical protein